MKTKLTKELLGEILNQSKHFPITSVSIVNKRNEIVYFTDDGDKRERHEINVHELMSKAKEWAYVNFAQITSTKRASGYWNIQVNSSVFKDFTGKTEYEAVFKACEWILKEIG